MSEKAGTPWAAIGAIGGLLGGAAALLAAFSGDWWQRVFPPPPAAWTMSAGVGADFRPHLPPTARPIERMTSPLFIGMSPEFSAGGRTDARAIVTRERIVLHIPGAQPVEFAWLWFTDNDGEGEYIERTGSASPFELKGAGEREIMFQPVSSYLWSNFVRDVHDAVAARHQYMTLRVESTLQADDEERNLAATCSIPLLHVLLVIQDRRRALQWVSIPCGAPVPSAAHAPVLIEPAPAQPAQAAQEESK